MVGFALGPECVVPNAAGRCASHWTPLKLTISAEKIDLLPAEIQKDVERPLEEMMAMRLERAQWADYKHEHWGDR